MIDNLHYALDGVWRVLLASLVFGAALPAVFALGVRSIAWAHGSEAYEVPPTGGGGRQPHRAGTIVAGLCFLVVLCGIALGITVIAAAGFGKQVSFEHGYPTMVAKDS